ncbi:uncharacterized protein BROUX77_001974 [Berkeleyomyces rouxiae]|uniref:uncharacterized protein n=1 Tax=Berkeleyomyces rouxiae TaxID=2035830 RepID=UPI003B787A93
MLLATAALAVAALLAAPARAVQLEFSDCLSKSYQDAGGIRFTPLYVDASFDTANSSHVFSMTVYGNVSGSSNPSESLPSWNDSEWEDPNWTTGKIVNQYNNGNITNLKTTVNVLSYRPYRNASSFCSRLGTDSCPLSPVFNASEITLPDGLPSFTLSEALNSSFALTTFATTFLIIYGQGTGGTGTQIGCISVNATPTMGSTGNIFTIVPLIIIIFVAAVNILAAMFCPWGTTDIFKWSSNHSREITDLLRLVTPGFADCLQYFQFVALTSSLSLDFPGYYRPIVSRVSWSTLLFDTPFVSNDPSWDSLVDGLYVTNSTHGLGDVGQLIGLSSEYDLWPCMMVWLMVIIACVLLLSQLGFLVRRIYRFVANIPKEDLRKKNLPFSLGNIVRIVFNFFLLPIVALSVFQISIGGDSPTSLPILASLSLLAVLGTTAWIGWVILRTVPRSDLFDQLPTLLLYGPVYNTYTDHGPPFALVPICLTILRGIAIGGAQGSGVAQISILALAEGMMVVAIVIYQPYDHETSMNLYTGIFAFVRLIVVLLMVAFAPTLGITEGPKGWVGYAILVIHGCVIIFGFFLNALQTLVEVLARMLGAGGHTTGGLSKIFGPRQLSRRMTHRGHGATSKQSHLSQTAMLEADPNRPGYYMPSGHARNESAGSLSGINRHNRSSSGFDFEELAYHPTVTRNFDSATNSTGPNTPAEATSFSFLQSNPSRPAAVAMTATSDPYYRPPRTRREATNSMPSNAAQGALAKDTRRPSVAATNDHVDLEADRDRSATPAPYAIDLAPRADYSTREVDLYYGLRGPALNSERPGRRLGTGPADPTGPVATAIGWMRALVMGKTKEKGKGFEVVRSHRMLPEMRDELEREPPPEGVPVATAMSRKGPIESDDDDQPKPRDWTISASALAHHRGNSSTVVGEPSRGADYHPGSRVDDEAAADGESAPLETGSKSPPQRPFSAGSNRVPSPVSSISSGFVSRDVSIDGNEGSPGIPMRSHPHVSATPMPFLRSTSEASTTASRTRHPSMSSTVILDGNSNQGSTRSMHRSTPSFGQVYQYNVVMDDVRLSQSTRDPLDFDAEAQQAQLDSGSLSRPVSGSYWK